MSSRSGDWMAAITDRFMRMVASVIVSSRVRFASGDLEYRDGVSDVRARRPLTGRVGAPLTRFCSRRRSS